MTDFNLDTLKKEMLDFYNKKLDGPREIIIYTGIGGKKLINKAFETSFLKELLEPIDKLSGEQKDKLKHMLDSTDEELFELAKKIITNYGN